VPPRYRLTLRPSFKSGATFEHAEFNKTGLFPGWDYPPTMPNAFVSPVLLLLYFNPALRSTIFMNQFNDRLLTSRQTTIVPELSFLFHQMESLSRLAYSYSTSLPYRGPRVRAWVPTNFLGSLTSTPEAQQLQILDGSPAAVDVSRRPEAFYLFLLYQIDKELSKPAEPKPVDSLHGTDFVSVNEFITGSGETSESTARAMTIELAYDSFREDTEPIRFGQVLQRALCRETRLRAWNQTSKSYETIVQRKIATSLPQILSLSCACAGRKEEDGLNRWRSILGAEDHWLPEIVEVELSDGGGVVVKQRGRASDKDWQTFKESSTIPATVSKLVTERRASATIRKYQYRLDAVVSFIRDDMDSNPDSIADVSGHHVVHVRVPKAYKKHLLSEQHKEVSALSSTDWSSSSMFVTDKNWNTKTFKERAEKVQSSLDALEEGDSTSESSWLLANGYVVSDTVIEDARAFHVAFKEPCLVVYRAVHAESPDQSFEVEDLNPSEELSPPIPLDVMDTRSLTDGRPPKYAVDIDSLPGRGDLIAFDAEFVSVQEEESTLTKSGSKVTLREVRHAVARISVIDCKTRKVIVDDHVLPQERVVDYLTRFSGIVARDLDPVQSPHHLISTRSAYLKLRLLMER
jgi:Ubiquitin carboxyl-terminal hydrolase